jgi:hypothetical protein
MQKLQVIHIGRLPWMRSIIQSWELVPLPPGRKLVKYKWIYPTKMVVDGLVSKYKAWLVAKGFS